MAVDSLMVDLGTPAPGFDLPTVDGGRIRLADISARVVVIIFACNHCPYVRHVEDELGRIAADHINDDVALVAISPNDVAAYPDDDAAHLAEQAARAGWTFPYAMDESQDVARQYRAACTPDFFLYGPDRTLLYRGAMDESSPKNGRPNDGHLLRAAIAQALAGGPVDDPGIPSMGCSIKWRED